MPSAGRSKGTNSVQNRKGTEITDSSGWTHIIRRGRFTETSKRATTAATGPSDLPLDLSLLSLGDNITVDQIGQNHKRVVRIWKESECCLKLSTFFRKENPDLGGLTPDIGVIKKCVCLGLGSLTSHRDSAGYELAALLSILDLLQSCDNISRASQHDVPKDQVIFQDPVFRQVDKDFLTKELGHRVVSTPSAFAEIDGETFLFAPHLEHEVLATALREARAMPALCITNSHLHEYRDTITINTTKNSSTKEARKTTETEPGAEAKSAADIATVSDVLTNFADTMETHAMPEFDRDTWCHFTSIYWPSSRKGPD